MNDYQRIEKAITYIDSNFRNQPTLEDVAKHVYLSPHHFQRLFKKWAGVSPKKFLQYITLENSKKLLSQDLSLSDASHYSGLSGTSRLYDLFINIVAMTPGEYKNGGRNLTIKCSLHKSVFGMVSIGSTDVGICYLSFSDKDSAHDVLTQFPNANIINETTQNHQNILNFINGMHNYHNFNLHIKGTTFQLKVWQALLKLPQGELATYGDISKLIGTPNANRAVGTAIGKNPIALLIPCHRVIRSTGIFGSYKWGSVRKKAIIGWECAKLENNIAV